MSKVYVSSSTMIKFEIDPSVNNISPESNPVTASENCAVM